MLRRRGEPDQHVAARSCSRRDRSVDICAVIREEQLGEEGWNRELKQMFRPLSRVIIGKQKETSVPLSHGMALPGRQTPSPASSPSSGSPHPSTAIPSIRGSVFQTRLRSVLPRAHSASLHPSHKPSNAPTTTDQSQSASQPTEGCPRVQDGVPFWRYKGSTADDPCTVLVGPHQKRVRRRAALGDRARAAH